MKTLRNVNTQIVTFSITCLFAAALSFFVFQSQSQFSYSADEHPVTLVGVSGGSGEGGSLTSINMDVAGVSGGSGEGGSLT